MEPKVRQETLIEIVEMVDDIDETLRDVLSGLSAELDSAVRTVSSLEGTGAAGMRSDFFRHYNDAIDSFNRANTNDAKARVKDMKSDFSKYRNASIESIDTLATALDSVEDYVVRIDSILKKLSKLKERVDVPISRDEFVDEILDELLENKKFLREIRSSLALNSGGD